MNFSRIVYNNVRDLRTSIYKTSQKLLCRTAGTDAGKPVTSSQNPNPIAASTTSSSTIPDVQGLSSAVIRPESDKMLPGTSKSGDYKNPEYFCYDINSYYEAEIEMEKFRLPQPSALRK